MTKRSAGSKPKAVQLRGEALKARIGKAVRGYADEMGDRLDPDRVSMKAIAARVPCSRTTLHKYESVVNDALRDIGYRAARRTGECRTEALAHRTELYRQRVEELEAELLALRRHHAEVYTLLLMHSVPVAVLLRDRAVTASEREGHCMLCGGPTPNAAPTNVVGLNAAVSRSKVKKRD